MTQDFAIKTRPIEGSITATSKPATEQISPEEFVSAIDTLLAVKGVKAVHWNQYTPYFNDGDPCEFGIFEFSVKLSSRFGTEGMGDYEDGYLGSYSLYEYKDGNYRGEKIYSLNGQDTTEIAHELGKLNALTGAAESVAKASFGDHATVTATKDGFEVEYYEHD